MMLRSNLQGLFKRGEATSLSEPSPFFPLKRYLVSEMQSYSRRAVVNLDKSPKQNSLIIAG
jgi:hypothetical protein